MNHSKGTYYRSHTTSAHVLITSSCDRKVMMHSQRLIHGCYLNDGHALQESCAIAKMTAQCALHMGALKIFGTPWLRPRPLFPTFSWAFVSIDPIWMFLQNLKSVALPVPEIIGGTQKIWAITGYDHAPFSPKFLMGFHSDRPCKYTRQIWSSWLYPFLR